MSAAESNVPAALDPDLFLALEDLELVAHGIVEGSLEGRHRSPFIGFSVEFDSHREYQPGDDVRYVNWKLWARQDRLYVKQFNADTNLNLYLLLDLSRSMACDHGPSTKWRYAIRAAAGLAYLALKGRDAIGLLLLGDTVMDYLPARTGPEHFRSVLTRMSEVEPQGGTGLARALDQAAGLCRRRSLVVVISDLFDEASEILAGLDHLRYHEHHVLVMHTLDPWELRLPEDGRFRFVDLETDERVETDAEELRDSYSREVDRWIGELRRGCEERGIDWMTCTTADPLRDILLAYLARREMAGTGAAQQRVAPR